MIRCPFCNFETEYPAEPGKVYECLGECYSTYARVRRGEDMARAKMRAVEIFFLDPEFNVRAGAEELERCDFREVEAKESEQFILFARERRVTDHEIEMLRMSGEWGAEQARETLCRLRSALDRFERNLTAGAPRDRLRRQARVIGKMADILREMLEKPQ